MTTEVEFANQFIKLLEVTTPSLESQNAFADSFNLNNIKKLPANFLFPPLKHPYGSINNNISNATDTNLKEKNDFKEEESEHGIEFTFKSLKQPKFNLSLILDISSSSNIYMVKTSLSKLLEHLDENPIIVEPSNIKLMIRTKTLQDSENVFQILENSGSTDKLSLNVLITQFKPKETNTVVEKQENVSKPVITDESWMKISNILLNDLKDQSVVDKTVQGFKNSL